MVEQTVFLLLPPTRQSPSGFCSEASLLLGWLRARGVARTAGFPRHGALLGRPHRSWRLAVVEKLCKRLTGCRFRLVASAWSFSLSRQPEAPMHHGVEESRFLAVLLTGIALF